MPHYTLNRTFTLRTTSGHAIGFVKNEPVYVPKMIEREVRAIGGERVDGDNVDMIDEVIEKTPELDGDERIEQIKIAFQLLIERNDSADFTGAGVPSVKAVEKIVGFDVTRGEVAETWAAMRAGE